MTTVMVSGGFDPVHVGHIDLLRNAAKFGDVVVVVMSDQWVVRKKGYCVMTMRDRADIISSVRYVDRVILCGYESENISLTITEEMPDMFCNGGDRTEANEAEHLACVEVGVVEAFNVGGKKRRSSSELVENPLKGYLP
jgi:cytidyltransferase-like protein